MNPRLIHAVPVYIANVDRGATVYDEDFDEPVTGKATYETPVKVMAQVKLRKYVDTQGNAGGFDLIGDGYLLIEKSDSLWIKHNALISKIDGIDYEYYVEDLRPAAHYKSSNFIMVVFRTKETGER